MYYTKSAFGLVLPCKVMLAEAVDGLLLATVHVYSPPLVTFRVCVYCAVTALFNTVSVPSVIVTESLVQVTVVAGPPVEIQVRVFIDNVTPSGKVISPNTCNNILIFDIYNTQHHTISLCLVVVTS